MFDFQASGQASTVQRRAVLPLAASVAIHTAMVILVLALTFSDGILERPRPTRAMVLLSPAPVMHAAPLAAQRIDRAPPRRFRAPAIRFAAAPLRESAPIPIPIPVPQIPLPEVPRPLLPSVEVAHLAAAPPPPPPPLRTDNLAPLAVRAPAAGGSAANRTSAALRSGGFEQIAMEAPQHPRAPGLLGEGFDDATMVPAAQPHHAGIAPALPVTRSVEILSKPRPAYTEDARRQRIEGEVLLKILFAASGEVRVLGTVRGLGHGLDENAIAAAEAIRFRPAERAGMAADSTAIVHIVFQLAY